MVTGNPHALTGRTELTVLLGDPVAQARAPELVNAELARRGIDARLMPLQVGPADFACLVTALRSTPSFRGAVVTMPHKRAVVPLLAGTSRRVSQTGACNVIRRRPDGTLAGDMLDGEAMVRAIHEAAGTVARSRVLLLGAGGAAAGIALALAEHGAARLEIHNRTGERASSLAARVCAAVPGADVRAVSELRGCWDVVVNASSVGMRPGDAPPLDPALLAGAAVVADAVISPDPTPLIAAAAGTVRMVVPGERMLAAQTELIVSYMFGKEPGVPQ